MSSFFVTLTSSTPVAGNTTNSFTTLLPEKLIFNSEWEVAVMTISYPNSHSTFTALEHEGFKFFTNGATHFVRVPSGRYETPKQLEEAMVQQLQRTLTNIHGEQQREEKPQVLAEHFLQKLAANAQKLLQDLSTTITVGSILNDALQEALEIVISLQKNITYMKLIRLRELHVQVLKKYITSKDDSAFSTVVQLIDNTLQLAIGYLDDEGRRAFHAFTSAQSVKGREKHDNDAYFLLKYNNLTKRFALALSKDIKHFEMTEKLKYMLGFSATHNFNASFAHVARYSPDVCAGLHSLFVYCDIIEPQVIGGVRASLLRTCNIKGAFGEVVEEVFVNPQYCKLQSKKIGEIRIDIRQQSGEPMPFEWGNVQCVLNFRKKTFV